MLLLEAMRLRRLELKSFRQFVKQSLRVDPYVTVLVGRNDTGKTNLLRQFFSQYLFETGINSADRPQLPGARPPIEFSAFWDVESGDESRFPLTAAFGEIPRTVEVRFQAHDGPDENWRFYADGQRVEAYAGKTPEGQPILRESLEPRQILPMPLYLQIARPIRSLFEARLFESPGLLGRPLAATGETSLLRLAGLVADTRNIAGRGIDEPWEPTFKKRSSLELPEVEARLEGLSAGLTTLLREWWTDPPGLSVHVKLMGGNDGAQQRINSYGIVCQIIDGTGLPCHGEGLLWF
jgi:hypothetical protein